MVYAGTMNAVGYALRVRVSVAAQGTLLDEVSRMLARAVEARSSYVRLADRAARLYAPLVHAARFRHHHRLGRVRRDLARCDHRRDRGAHHHLPLRARPRHSGGAGGGVRRAVPRRRSPQFR